MIQYLKNDSISCLHTALVAKSRGGTLKGRTDSALEIYQETLEKAEEKDRIKSDETEKEEPRENRGKSFIFISMSEPPWSLTAVSRITQVV